MENMFVWVLIFAGAAIALLGLFLVASERELKSKRLEIERLAAKLGDGQANQADAPMLLTQAVDGEEVADLQARNQELQRENANLSAKLELGRRTINELESADRQEPNTQSEVKELRAANETLSSEITALQERVQSYEARLNEMAADDRDAADRQRQLQGEIAELEKQLAARAEKIRALEGSQQQLAQAESLESTHAEEQRQLHSRIGELERQLAAAQEKLGELDGLRQQLAESENRCQDLEAENLRHENEVPRWQARIAEAEENRRRLSGLREPFDALLAKHAEMAERQNRFEEDLAAFGGLMALPVKATIDEAGADVSVHEAFGAAPITGTVRATPTMGFDTAAMLHRATEAPNDRSEVDEGATVAPAQLAADGPPIKQRKRRFGLFGLIVLVPVATVFAFGNWNKPADRQQTGAARPDRVSAGQPDAGRGPAQPRDLDPAARDSVAATKPQQTSRVNTKTSGTYEITQPSRVYAAPTEFATLIGDIKPGVKVFVADARDGWLEIHSKHGRPPGYIRQEIAAPIARQN